MSKALIVAELDGAGLNSSTAKCVSCAQAMDLDAIDIIVIGTAPDAAAAEAAKISGVNRVLSLVTDAQPVAATSAPPIVEFGADYDYLLGPSTTFGKDLMPRIAALLDVGQVSDIMTVESPRRFVRPVYAGNALITVEVPAASKVVATVRTASWREAERAGNAEIQSVTATTEIPGHTRFVELAAAASDRPDLQTAKRVVSGGRALASGENFDLLYRLADKLGAGVGASRAAVDAGYVANDMQVGQTGKIIAPDLYIAIGISGAIQHLTGIKDAGTIVAINKDPEAPIFEVADLGLVADLFEAVPELIEKLG
mgnify:CR=1 FL=1